MLGFLKGLNSDKRTCLVISISITGKIWISELWITDKYGPYSENGMNTIQLCLVFRPRPELGLHLSFIQVIIWITYASESKSCRRAPKMVERSKASIFCLRSRGERRRTRVRDSVIGPCDMNIGPVCYSEPLYFHKS